MGRKGSRTRETEAQLPKVNLKDSPGAAAETLEAPGEAGPAKGSSGANCGLTGAKGLGPWRGGLGAGRGCGGQ